jgi:hypothetical protein
MSTTSETAGLQALQDRVDVIDVLYRYFSAIDSFDKAGVRSTFTDDMRAEYGNLDPVDGGDALTEWIWGATATITWQHHLASVYHVDIDGDSAHALTYMTSHQVFDGDPDHAKILVGRYHDDLRRTPEGWRISRRQAEFLWAETRTLDEEFLSMLGGRGPEVWPRA